MDSKPGFDLIEKYNDKLNADLYLDLVNIKEKQLKLPSIKHFWVGQLIQNKKKLHRLENELRDIKSQVGGEIISKSPIALAKNTIASKIDNNERVRQIAEEIQECQFVIEYLEKIEKILSSMHWEIKNIIELQQLERL